MDNVIDKIQEINERDFSNLNGRSIISLSKVVEFVSEKFDKEKTAKACEEKGKKDPNYKYAGMTAEEIIASWEEKADESKMYGSLLDEYTEQFFSGNSGAVEIWKLDHNWEYDSRLRNTCMGFEEFYKDISVYGFEYVGREITVYGECVPEQPDDMPFDSEVYGEVIPDVVVGRIDCLFRNKNNGKFLIVDWKTTDEIKTSSYGHKKLKGPAYQYDDCDISKYIIQVQTYKNDLVKTYKLANPDEIAVCICNLRRTPDTYTGKRYQLYKENVAFNSATLDKIVNFAIKKRSLMSKV